MAGSQTTQRDSKAPTKKAVPQTRAPLYTSPMYRERRKQATAIKREIYKYLPNLTIPLKAQDKIRENVTVTQMDPVELLRNTIHLCIAAVDSIIDKVPDDACFPREFTVFRQYLFGHVPGLDDVHKMAVEDIYQKAIKNKSIPESMTWNDFKAAMYRILLVVEYVYEGVL